MTSPSENFEVNKQTSKWASSRFDGPSFLRPGWREVVTYSSYVLVMRTTVQLHYKGSGNSDTSSRFAQVPLGLVKSPISLSLSGRTLVNP
jgi:hypothetical protein